MRRLGFGILVAAVTIAVQPAAAATGPWGVNDHVKARWITATSGKSPGTESLRAGLEVVVEDGWAITWRGVSSEYVAADVIAYPGYIQDMTLEWPAPDRLATSSAVAGYKGHALLPVRIHHKRPKEDVMLNAEVTLTLCREKEERCIRESVTPPLQVSTNRAVDADVNAARKLFGARNSLPKTMDAKAIRIFAASPDSNPVKTLIFEPEKKNNVDPARLTLQHDNARFSRPKAKDGKLLVDVESGRVNVGDDIRVLYLEQDTPKTGTFRIRPAPADNDGVLAILNNLV